MTENVLETPEYTDIQHHEGRRADVKVVSEPLTYDRHTRTSYFRDLAYAATDDQDAKRRLERHAREMRVNPDRTQGVGGYFAPPRWLIADVALAPSPARVLSRLIPHFDLPPGAQSVNVPRLTVGAITTTPGDDSAVAQQDITDTSVTSPAATFAGQADVAMQLFEQSPIGPHLDTILFRELERAYDTELEQMLINGTGTGGQFTGILNVAGITTVTFTSGSPTASLLFPLFGQAIAAIGNKRFAPPEAVLLTTSRWAWLTTSEDTALRPFGALGFTDTDMTVTVPIASTEGFPTYLDDAIPITLGAGGNQDTIIVCKPSDMMLFESPRHTSVMLDVLSGTMQARFQLHGYAAALLGRFPSSIAMVRGTGMVVQTGF